MIFYPSAQFQENSPAPKNSWLRVYKGVFYKKGEGIYLHLTFFYELVNIFAVVVYIQLCKNTDLLCGVHKENNSLLSIHSSNFHLKIHKRHGTFFERERVTHHIKRSLKGRGTYKTNRDEQGEVGSNIGNFKNALGNLSHIALRNT